MDPVLSHLPVADDIFKDNNRVIDHIFAERSDFTPIQAHLFGDIATNGEYPSDHFGVTATLRLI